jgi:hypothetical protein
MRIKNSMMLVLKKAYFICDSLSTILGEWLNAGGLGCFKFLTSEVGLSWVEAKQKCEEIGGYLAEPITLG